MSTPAKKKRGRPPAKKAGARKIPPAEGVPADQLGNVTLIKRYANRRLYDTKRSRYVTMDDVVDVLANGEEIQVIDETTGADVTKRVLTQVVLHEEEGKNLDLLPLAFLKKLIRYRDDGVREYFQRYMIQSLDAYMQAQKVMEQRMQGFAGMDPARLAQMFPWLAMMPGMGAQPFTPVIVA